METVLLVIAILTGCLAGLSCKAFGGSRKKVVISIIFAFIFSFSIDYFLLKEVGWHYSIAAPLAVFPLLSTLAGLCISCLPTRCVGKQEEIKA